MVPFNLRLVAVVKGGDGEVKSTKVSWTDALGNPLPKDLADRLEAKYLGSKQWPEA